MDRVVGEVVGVVAIGMTAGNAEDPLSEQRRQRVPDLPGLPPVHQTPGETRHQPIHALRRLEQDGAAIGTRVPAVERRDEGLVEEIRKEDSLWYRMGRHVRASVVGKCLLTSHLYHAEALFFYRNRPLPELSGLGTSTPTTRTSLVPEHMCVTWRQRPPSLCGSSADYRQA